MLGSGKGSASSQRHDRVRPQTRGAPWSIPILERCKAANEVSLTAYALRTLTEHRASLDRLSTQLLERNRLTRSDLDEILGG